MKKCKKGASCLSTCISRGKECRGTLKPSVSLSLTNLTKSLSEAKREKTPYGEWRVIASGYQGQVAIDPEGTRVVKTLFSPEKGEKPEFGPLEVEIATKMGELGHSPKIHSSSKNHLEMDLAPGKPLWATFQRGEDEPLMNTNQARSAGYALRDLHRMGYAHNDSHSQQFLVSGDNVKLVDFGLSVKVSEKPLAVLQDLAKINSLVQFNNPELQGDPYFKLVNKYLTPYREIGKSQSKAAKAKRIELAEGYFRELANTFGGL